LLRGELKEGLKILSSISKERIKKGFKVTTLLSPPKIGGERKKTEKGMHLNFPHLYKGRIKGGVFKLNRLKK
jgi:hypothetical protein